MKGLLTPPAGGKLLRSRLLKVKRENELTVFVSVFVCANIYSFQFLDDRHTKKYMCLRNIEQYIFFNI